MEWFWFGHLE